MTAKIGIDTTADMYLRIVELEQKLLAITKERDELREELIQTQKARHNK